MARNTKNNNARRDTPLKGSNLSTVRGTNERLILHLVRTHKQLTKAQATQITGLSANAVSVIFRALEAEGYLLPCEPIRGRIGQPSTPVRLNPEARSFLGLHIGRRSYRLAVVDFAGNVLSSVTKLHTHPTPQNLLAFATESVPALLSQASLELGQIDGFNVAAPNELWSWQAEFGCGQANLDVWRSFDIQGEIAALFQLPVLIENDATAACRAEQVFGGRRDARDWAYFFIDSFIGGGVVLNGSVFPGRRGHAGGFGPLRVPNQTGGDRLMDHASLLTLEKMLPDQSESKIARLYNEPSDWSPIQNAVDAWIKRAGESLAYGFVSTLAVIDFEEFVIDGTMPRAVLERLIEEAKTQLLQRDLQGIELPTIRAGQFGHIAGALGAAGIQISNEFMIDQNKLLQDNHTIVSSTL